MTRKWVFSLSRHALTHGHLVLRAYHHSASTLWLWIGTPFAQPFRCVYATLCRIYATLSHNHVVWYLRNKLVAYALHFVWCPDIVRTSTLRPPGGQTTLGREGVGVGGTGPDHSPLTVTVGPENNFYFFITPIKPFLSHQNVLCMFRATASDVMRLRSSRSSVRTLEKASDVMRT
jgi:hypothetical protein